MISALTSSLRNVRRALSRNEWMVRLLGLERSRGTEAEPGLVMVQIDGLSRAEFERALRHGRMPFLASLLDREEYRMHSHYSGLPSTTPAVQGELFYGVPGCVPAFQFREDSDGEIRSMLNPETDRRIERKLRERGAPLLKGGAIYAGIYAAGAARPSYCAVTVGAENALKAANPFALALAVVLHGFVAARLVGLGVLEFGLALADAVKGVSARESVLSELAFIPKRVAMCILLREVCALGARADAARGAPWVHCNFIGYDEQSHRRGPSSRFAHFALKGIDSAIKGIWRAAEKSKHRSYDVWIYSDHGQEAVLPFPEIHHRTFQEAVAEVLEDSQAKSTPRTRSSDSVHSKRHALLGGKLLQRLLGHPKARNAAPPAKAGGMGPVGHVYAERAYSTEEKRKAARDLVRKLRIPTVAYVNGNDEIEIVNEGRSAPRPFGETAVEATVGADHPFPAEMQADLERLIRHELAGDFVLFGWRPKGRPLSFVNENGAHAGPGYRETHAFCLLPPDVKVTLRDGHYLRPVDLREAALGFMGLGEETVPAQPAAEKGHVRVMSYNVHNCLGLDGLLSPERIARVVARYGPDVLSLQEIDVGRQRSEGRHQAEVIADLLEMEFHFHPSFQVGEEQYGNAILSRLPFRHVKAGALPGAERHEPRGVVWVEVDAEVTFQFLTTHFGLRPREKRQQAAVLASDEWLGRACRAGPVVFCGDFNSGPQSQVYRRIKDYLEDAFVLGAPPPLTRTYLRLARIDHVFASPGVEVVGVMAPVNTLTRVASDHLPVIADLRFA